jgi:signal transduction histidine kinase
MRPTQEIRQAAYLTTATWTLSGILYLIPYRLFQGGPGAYVVLSVVNICMAGAALSAGVYVAIRRVRGLGAPARLASLAAVVLLAAAVLALYDAATSTALRALTDAAGTPAPFALRATTNFVALVWQFALLGAAFTVLEANNLGRERERELGAAHQAAAQAEAAASAARLAALRYQLNPHFLFNTLNAVSSLVVTRRNAEADAMLAKLSDFLRATLVADPEGMISVEDELATLQHYLEIEAVRFGDRLAVAFVCPPDLEDATLPSFLLQPLVENAIKYAVSPANRSVTVRIEVERGADDLVVTVQDDGESAGQVQGGTGLGLANVRQRLRVLYGARASLDAVAGERGFVARVRLPLERRAPKVENAA